MTDELFMNELRIRAYIDQIGGYPLGHPRRVNFKPIVPVVNTSDGKVIREATLNLSCYHDFSAEDRALLLAGPAAKEGV